MRKEEEDKKKTIHPMFLTPKATKSKKLIHESSTFTPEPKVMNLKETIHLDEEKVIVKNEKKRIRNDESIEEDSCLTNLTNCLICCIIFLQIAISSNAGPDHYK